MNKKNTILLADDHPLFRRGLRDLIANDSEMEIVAECGSGSEAIRLIQSLKPDLAVLDVDMPEASGLDVLRAGKECSPDTRYLMLTMYNEEDIFNEALDEGARGYVLKESAVTDIVAAIHEVLRHGYYVSPTLTMQRIERTRRSHASLTGNPTLAKLSVAQLRIIRLIADQKTSKEIADSLGISYRTVENHRSAITAKLGLSGSNSLLKFAIEHKSAIISLADR
jgi:DNA-binding NarL/FixJ family response regulator